MTNQLREQIRKNLQDESMRDGTILFDRMTAMGMLDANGEVTGRLIRWDAYLAITGVERNGDDSKIELFHCLSPTFGMPGGDPEDVTREDMVNLLKRGKKIITAVHDDRLSIWRERCHVTLTPAGFIRCDAATDEADDVGNLPIGKPAVSSK